MLGVVICEALLVTGTALLVAAGVAAATIVPLLHTALGTWTPWLPASYLVAGVLGVAGLVLAAMVVPAALSMRRPPVEVPDDRAAGVVHRRTWREYPYLLVAVFMAAPLFALPLLGAVFSVLSLLTIGLPFLVAVLWLARRSVRWFRVLPRALLGWDWAVPRPVGLRELIGDPVAWRALAYCFLGFPVKLAGAYLGAVALVLSPIFLTYPAWWFINADFFGVSDSWAGTWWLAAQAVAALLAFPWVIRLFVRLDRLLAHAVLTRARTRTGSLSSSRAGPRYSRTRSR